MATHKGTDYVRLMFGRLGRLRARSRQKVCARTDAAGGLERTGRAPCRPYYGAAYTLVPAVNSKMSASYAYSAVTTARQGAVDGPRSERHHSLKYADGLDRRDAQTAEPVWLVRRCL